MATDVRKLVGTRVRALRLIARLTQEELGERAGLSYKFIGEVERGVGNPTIATLAEIAGALGVTPADLLAGDEGYPGGRVSLEDYAVVREARDSLEGVLRRLEPKSPRRRPRR